MHYLVAAYLQVEPPDLDEDEDDDDEEPVDANAQGLAQLGSLAPVLQTSAETRAAIEAAPTSLDKLAVLERIFYGEVKDG